MKFRYKSFFVDRPSVAFPDRKAILRPIIPIELINGKRRVKTFALIDSGADYCIFHRELEDLLGLTGGQPDNFGGITGNTAIGYFHNIEISIGGKEENLYCCFSDGIGQFGYGVLGQRGFFNLFKVLFDYKKGEIEIKGN